MFLFIYHCWSWGVVIVIFFFWNDFTKLTYWRVIFNFIQITFKGRENIFNIYLYKSNHLLFSNNDFLYFNFYYYFNLTIWNNDNEKKQYYYYYYFINQINFLIIADKLFFCLTVQIHLTQTKIKKTTYSFTYWRFFFLC